MPITGEIVRAGEILLMMVRAVYWVVDERWLARVLATLPMLGVQRSVWTTERARLLGLRGGPFRWMSCD
jgi:hypothetical protein